MCDSDADGLCVCMLVPGPVSSPAVNEIGSHHVKLTWNKPQQMNGIPRGYIISYREGQALAVLLNVVVVFVVILGVSVPHKSDGELEKNEAVA